jgi:hypothetical protein
MASTTLNCIKMISQYLINANIEKFIRLMSCPPARQNDERQKGEKIVEWMWGVGNGHWATLKERHKERYPKRPTLFLCFSLEEWQWMSVLGFGGYDGLFF